MKKKISVCMASYNGERYIASQLVSILNQLSENDEVIIVDDNSNDDTIKKIADLDDARIKIINNEKNIGVAGSFEKAIYQATGDIIFLSDQDDIWLPGKVNYMVDDLLSSDRKVCLSDAYIWDGDTILDETFLNLRSVRKDLIGSLYKNFFIGCCMAFEREMKDLILPFPRQMTMHDQWIGLTSIFNGGFVENKLPLMLYRRHESNVTQMKRSGMQKVLLNRMINIYMIAVILIRRGVR